MCVKEWAGQPKSFIWVDFSGSHKLGFSLADSDYLRRRCLVYLLMNLGKEQRIALGFWVKIVL